MKVAVKHLTVQDTQLVVRLFIFQTTESLFLSDDSSKIKVNGVEYLVIGDTARNRIVCLFWLLALSAKCYIVKPLFIMVDA